MAGGGGWQTGRRPDGRSGSWRAKMPLAGLGTPRSGEAVIPFGRVPSTGLLAMLVGEVQETGLRWVWSSGEKSGLERGLGVGAQGG